MYIYYVLEFALLKICLSRYELHCRSLLLLSRFIDEKITFNSNSVVDQIFNCIWKKNQNDDDIEIPDCSRIEWIWALYIVSNFYKINRKFFEKYFFCLINVIIFRGIKN